MLVCYISRLLTLSSSYPHALLQAIKGPMLRQSVERFQLNYCLRRSTAKDGSTYCTEHLESYITYEVQLQNMARCDHTKICAWGLSRQDQPSCRCQAGTAGVHSIPAITSHFSTPQYSTSFSGRHVCAALVHLTWLLGGSMGRSILSRDQTLSARV